MHRKLFSCVIFTLTALTIPCSALFTSGQLADTVDEQVVQEEEGPIPIDQLPWLTGPIVCPSGHVVPTGHMNIEPYFNVNVGTGAYDAHWKSKSAKNNFYNIQTQVPIQVGVCDRLDVTIVPQFSWNHIQGASHWVYNDLPLEVDFQILYDTPGRWPPAIKLTFKATAPLGKYQKLNPDEKGTDSGGGGTWNPGIQLVFGRLFHYTGVHFLATRLAFAYTIPNSVHVKGLNAYGGGHHTYGTVYPGPSFFSDLGLEYTLARKWALALDLVYTHNNHTKFKGHRGSTDGVPNKMGRPSSEQFSLAPAIEYNWSANCGLIAGVWFSVAGRNAAEFINGVIAINIYK